MQRLLLILMTVFFMGIVVSRASAQSSGFRLEGIGSQDIPVTLDKMTNLVFPVDVQKGVKVSRGILAQKVGGLENVIELKALRRKFTTTNLSVYGKNGRLYSFVLRFSDDSSILNFRVLDDGGARPGVEALGTPVGSVSDDHPIHLSGLPADLISLGADADQLGSEKGFLHLSVRRERMRLVCDGIYLRDSLEWFEFRLANRSQIAYQVSLVRFYTQDRTKAKRKAIQQLEMDPVYDGHPGAVAGDTSVRFAVGFNPFTVTPGKNLVVEVAEPDGGRVLVLKIKGKMLLRARKS